MGHIVFAAPGIAGFHLLERLRRELRRRGHRVSVLCRKRRELTFWRAQIDDVEPIGPAADGWLTRTQPDLLLFHQNRDTEATRLHRAAQRQGLRVLWTGSGLLPHTLQVDGTGLDGDAGARRHRAADYRCVEPDPGFLDACLAHALGGAEPTSLPRAAVRIPPKARRLADALAAMACGRFADALGAWTGWREALSTAPMAAVTPAALEAPFAALLLQAEGDPRLHLDADASLCRAHARLVRATVAATEPLAATVVVVPPPGSTARQQRALAAIAPTRVRIAEPGNAAAVAAASLVTVTVNHPLATAALLAGTPVVHFGRALYGMEGVTWPCSVAELPAALPLALAKNRVAIRRRFLTWLLRHGHVWCSPTHPSFNGIRGLIDRIEQKLSDRAERPLAHRPGPPWPLAAP